MTYYEGSIEIDTPLCGVRPALMKQKSSLSTSSGHPGVALQGENLFPMRCTPSWWAAFSGLFVRKRPCITRAETRHTRWKPEAKRLLRRTRNSHPNRLTNRIRCAILHLQSSDAGNARRTAKTDTNRTLTIEEWKAEQNKQVSTNTNVLSIELTGVLPDLL